MKANIAGALQNEQASALTSEGTLTLSVREVRGIGTCEHLSLHHLTFLSEQLPLDLKD
jgi:hypothetical protein